MSKPARIETARDVLEHAAGLTQPLDVSKRRAAVQSIEWRPVPGYEGSYEVSENGDVRSLTRKKLCRDGRTRSYKGRTLTPVLDPTTGYLKVILWIDNQGRTRPLHRLVAEAFLPAVPGCDVVCHSDGSRGNNHVSNLRWGTHSDNMYDNVKHGGNRQALQTHCKRGHPFDDENTYRMPQHPDRRQCRECKRLVNARIELRKKALRLGIDSVTELADELREA
jgi:hypothetical protein